MTSSFNGGLASRTPIKFRPTIDSTIKYNFPDYQQFLDNSDHDFLIYGWRKEVSENKYYFIIVQGAKFSGRLTAEVAISATPRYPYYKLSDTLDLGTFGYRERVAKLMCGDDYSHKYSTAAELQRVTSELVSVFISRSLRLINDKVEFTINKAQSTWIPIYDEWKDIKAQQQLNAEAKYIGLIFEDEARDFITKNVIQENKYDRFLGPLKRNYNEASFFDSHIFMMARGLEFLTPPSLTESEKIQEAKDDVSQNSIPRKEKYISWADILGPAPTPEPEKITPAVQKTQSNGAPLDDCIAYVCGRQAQAQSVSLSTDPQKRRLEYAFLKSLSALENIYQRQRL